MRMSAATKNWLAPLLTVLAYMVGYGWAVLLSVLILAQGYDPPGASSSSSMSDPASFMAEATFIVLGLLLAAGATWSLGRGAFREWFIGRQPCTPGRGLLVAGLVLGLDLAGFWLFAWINPPQPAQDPTAHALWYDIGAGLLPGAIGEEFIVLALPIVVVRRMAPQLLDDRRPAAAFVLMLVAGRVAYHLYQGAWAWSHLPWAAGAVLLYLWTGRVWPQILAHAFYDTALALYDHHEISQSTEMALLHGVAVGLVLLGTLRLARGRPPSRLQTSVPHLTTSG